MPFDYQMVTFEEIIKNDFFKWAHIYICKCDTTALTTYFYIVRAVLSLKFYTIYRIERYIRNPIFLLIIIHGDAIGLL